MECDEKEAALAVGTPDFDARVAGLFRYAHVGRRVNGVAHDLNNFLGAIMAYAELIAIEKNLSPECKRMLGEIIEGVQKASSLVSEITGVARKESSRIGMVHPPLLVRHVLDLHLYELKTQRIAVDTRIEENIPSLPGNAPRLELALSYILNNAMEALEGQQKRRISVQLRRTKEAVEINVQNSGPLVPEALRERMFEPYVTTKDGMHLGLGLPLARATIAQHAGALFYTPEDGFTVTLPWENGLTPI